MNPKHCQQKGIFPSCSEPGGLGRNKSAVMRPAGSCGGDLVAICGFVFKLRFPQGYSSMMLDNLGRRAK